MEFHLVTFTLACTEGMMGFFVTDFTQPKQEQAQFQLNKVCFFCEFKENCLAL